ncbi:VanW family protein [Bacillus luteolus]|uniref:VanW family protein n=1 Tax=Litchfieldia luteola TaxID=682179 RepID=A0ABR9QKK6_9BACI|nr:VanW family protein [Cytobacillus luteolus]MBP1941898.1 vancomycin resistance protein YoaR [Cytobacillus luteolus]
MKLLSILALMSIFLQPINPQENLILTKKGETISIVNRGEFSIPLLTVPVIDESKYNQFINDLDSLVYEKPINAKFGKYGELLQEKVGYRLNQDKFRSMFYNYFFNEGPLKVAIPLSTIYPRVDSELLVSIHTKQIGQYMTYYKTRNKERSHNIGLATEAINNTVVFPGETFSFNEVVGKRTEEKGYLPAPIIIKGELSEGIGGGICQVSSTLFNSVDLAGLDIVQRYSHSKQVPYVPPGRDATVSWYGPDFRFKNTYNQPILIRAFTSGGRCIIKIYSSDVINYKPRTI